MEIPVFDFMKSNPMQQARAIPMLNKKIRIDNGVVIPIHQWIEGFEKGLEIKTSKINSSKSSKGYTEKPTVGDHIVFSKAEQDYYKYIQDGGESYTNYLIKKKIYDTKVAKEKEAQRVIDDKAFEIKRAQQETESLNAKYKEIKNFIENGKDATLKKFLSFYENRIAALKSGRQTQAAIDDIAYNERMIEQTKRQVDHSYKIATELYHIVNGQVEPRYKWNEGDSVLYDGKIETKIEKINAPNALNRIATYKVEKREGIYNPYISYDGLFPIEKLKPMKAEYTPINLITPNIKSFIPAFQLDIIKQGLKGEEKEYFGETLTSLDKQISAMPKTYETENIRGMDKIAELHYFKGGSDWYIVEKDSEGEQLQAFGYAILNSDLENAEFGYINIEELKKLGVELDLNFTPKPLSEILGKKEAKVEKLASATPSKKLTANEEVLSIALQDVISLPKYRDLDLGEAKVLYSIGMGKKIDDLFYSNTLTVVDSIVKSLDDSQYVVEDGGVYQISELGAEFMQAVNARIETIKNVKSGNDLFPENANIDVHTPEKIYLDMKSCLVSEGEDDSTYIFEGKEFINKESGNNEKWRIVGFYKYGIIIEHVTKNKLADKKKDRKLSFKELRNLYMETSIDIDGIDSLKTLDHCIKLLEKCIDNVDLKEEAQKEKGEKEETKKAISEMKEIEAERLKNQEIAETLSSINGGVWDELKITSGSALYADLLLQEKYKALLDKKIKQANIDYPLSMDVHEILEDNNEHSLNQYLYLSNAYGPQERDKWIAFLEKIKPGSEDNPLNIKEGSFLNLHIFFPQPLEKMTKEILESRLKILKKMDEKNPSTVLKTRIKLIDKMLKNPEKFCGGGCVDYAKGGEPLTVEKYLLLQEKYNEILDRADEKLKSSAVGHINEYGLVDAETKKSDKYIQANKEYAQAFELYRNFNSTVPNEIKREAALLKRQKKIDRLDDGGNIGKFRVGDLVYNKDKNTIGIVRDVYPGEEHLGEIRTDADGNVNVDDLEYYHPGNKTHKGAHIAPSTKKELQYVIVSEKDGYTTILTRPTTKDFAENNFELFTRGLPRGEKGKIATLEELKGNKKIIGEEYLEMEKMAGGGKIDGEINSLIGRDVYRNTGARGSYKIIGITKHTSDNIKVELEDASGYTIIESYTLKELNDLQKGHTVKGIELLKKMKEGGGVTPNSGDNEFLIVENKIAALEPDAYAIALQELNRMAGVKETSARNTLRSE